jgi:hypothetical protein
MSDHLLSKATMLGEAAAKTVVEGDAIVTGQDLVSATAGFAITMASFYPGFSFTNVVKTGTLLNGDAEAAFLRQVARHLNSVADEFETEDSAAAEALAFAGKAAARG